MDSSLESLRQSEGDAEQLRSQLKAAIDKVNRLETLLKKEKMKSKDLSASLEVMQAEREKLTTEWSTIRKDIT